MKISVKSIVGGVTYLFEIDEADEMQALHKAISLGNPPKYCNECKNTEHFRMETNKDKDGNIYVNVVCGKCFAKSKLGQYKSKGYFWHQFKKYEYKKQSDDTLHKGNEGGGGNNDLPF